MYSTYLHAGRNRCGFEWGAMANFVPAQITTYSLSPAHPSPSQRLERGLESLASQKKRSDWVLEDKGFFGRALQLCDGNGQLLGLQSAKGTGACDLLHVGTAASWATPTWVQHLQDYRLCRRFPVLSRVKALNCTVRQSTY